MNYLKKNSEFICEMMKPLIVMLVAFFTSALVACSDDKPVSGGSAEETGIYANLEDITIKGRARMAVSSNEDAGLKQIVVVGLEKGTLVTLYELDPKSFEKTGTEFSEVISSDDGSFAFENVTLVSPYVLITALRPGSASAYAYSAFADVRDADEIYMDILTHLEALRALYLVESGVAYVQAKEQARTEVLEAFGIYGMPDDIREKDEREYAAMVYAVSNTLPISTISVFFISQHLDELFGSIAEKGSFLNVDSAMDENFVDVVNYYINGLISFLQIPAEGYEKLGEDWERLYRENLLMEKYYAGMFSVVFNAGQCSQDGEGKVFKNPNTSISEQYVVWDLVCRSGNWHLLFPEMEHAEGTMTDPRDGKVYKTITVDVGDTLQTWMAENLRFDMGDGSSCDEKWSDIEGCYYSRLAVLNLDSSYLVTRYPYESIEACIEELSFEDYNPDGGIEAICEREMSAEPQVDIDWDRLDLSSSVKYQGVCPEGWRLPKIKDWNRLLLSVHKYYGLKNDFEAMYLYDIAGLGNPLGFGLAARYSIMWVGHTPDYIPPVTSPGLVIFYGADLAISPGKTSPDDVVNMVHFAERSMSFDEFSASIPVRCIKD